MLDIKGQEINLYPTRVEYFFLRVFSFFFLSLSLFDFTLFRSTVR